MRLCRIFSYMLTFQSTCPARGTTPQTPPIARQRLFQSTCPARGTTTHHLSADSRAHISIHVPREGHDQILMAILSSLLLFQSTCPARGTTKVRYGLFHGFCNFNPRAPRGARRGIRNAEAERREFQSTCPARGTTTEPTARIVSSVISIHVPREGHDFIAIGIISRPIKFQSTCPARGTTTIKLKIVKMQAISIHVPREGHDHRATSSNATQAHFNPRAPRGARRKLLSRSYNAMTFQSTCPARGTTAS